MAETQDKNPIQVAGRLFSALEYLAGHGPADLETVTNALGLNKSTTHRVLSSLIYMGYAVQDPETGKYDLSLKVVSLSNQVLRRVNVVGIVRPFLNKLMEETGETVHFAKREGTEAIYIDKLVSQQNSIQMVSHIGGRIPLYCSGIGNAIMSEMSNDEIERIWNLSKVEALTPYTITSFMKFMDKMDVCRSQGYAIDEQENQEGVRCIAAAIHSPGGQVNYAFSISAPVFRMEEPRMKELIPKVLAAKEAIDRALTYTV